MCLIRILNCCNRRACTKPCGVGVVFCESSMKAHEKQTSEYLPTRSLRIRSRQGCQGLSYLSSKVSFQHLCYDCDTESYMLLEKALFVTGGNLGEALALPALAITGAKFELEEENKTMEDLEVVEENGELKPVKQASRSTTLLETLHEFAAEANATATIERMIGVKHANPTDIDTPEFYHFRE